MGYTLGRCCPNIISNGESLKEDKYGLYGRHKRKRSSSIFPLFFPYVYYQVVNTLFKK